MSVQRANDFADRQHSTGAQLISTIGAGDAERAARAVRDPRAEPRAECGVGHRPGDQRHRRRQLRRPDGGGVRRRLRLHAERHAGQQQHDAAEGQPRASRPASTCSGWPTRASSPQAQLYTFPNAAAYLAARDGTNRLGYTSFTAVLRPARPRIQHLAVRSVRAGRLARVARTSRCSTACATTSTACRMPIPNAPVATSREFPTSGNNFAPRLGAVWTLGDEPADGLRANTGMMYDQTLNAIYEQALQNDGTNARASATFTPTQAGAPAFPAVLSAGAGRAAQPRVRRSIPDFKVARSWQNNVQFERALRRSLLGRGRRVLRQGLQPAGRHEHQPDQPDRHARRRPPDLQHRRQRRRRASIPRYNVINSVQSPGESTYKNMTLQLTRRSSKGIGFDFAYTLGKSEDNAPITGTLSVQGDAGPVGHDQPRSRSRSEHPRPAPHLRRQHRRDAAVRARRRRAARSSTTTCSASRCSWPAASR